MSTGNSLQSPPVSEADTDPGRLLEAAVQAWTALNAWCIERDWAGYDPYDLKAQAWNHWLRIELPFRPGRFVARKVVDAAERRWPMPLRRLLGVKPAVNANTIALAARSYLAIARTRYASAAPQKSLDFCMDWLVQHSSRPRESGKLGWGYPFTWYAGPGERTVLPPNTPLSVVTSEAGHAFLDRHAMRGEAGDLECATACGRLITSEFYRDEVAEDRICFGYGSLDRFHVINANLNSATYLTRLARMTSDGDLLDLARRARRYSVELQNDDGSWFYCGPPYSHPSVRAIDGYHTGMVLQWLEMCQTLDPMPGDEPKLTKGLAFYLEQLFEPCGAPRHTPDSRYPQDVHLLAQGLVTLGALSARRPAAREYLSKLLAWGLANLRNADGSFAYRRHENYIDRTPYMRWGQGWMLWGLACAIASLAN
jgi:hypothetical protein